MKHKLLTTLMCLMALIGAASAAVTEEYPADDIVTLLLNLIGGIFSGISARGVLIGTVLGLVIAITLLNRVLASVVKLLKGTKGMGNV